MKFSFLIAVVLQIFISRTCLANEAVDCSKFPIEIKTIHPGSTIATDQQVRLVLTSAEIACVKKTISGVRDYQSLFKCPNESSLISSTPVESVSGEKKGQVQLSVYCKSSQTLNYSKKNNNSVPKKESAVDPAPAQITRPSTPATNPSAR